METHVAFDKVRLFWHNLGYESMGIMEAQAHMGGIWVFFDNLSIQVFVLDMHDPVVMVCLECSSRA